MIPLESLIQSQKISFFKRYADPEYAAETCPIDILLKPVAGPYLVERIFRLSNLPS